MIFNLSFESGKPVYIQIKKHIERLVREGILKPGTKLPSTRELARSLGVSRNTVVQAYSLLEAEEIVQSTTGRGTYIKSGIYEDKALKTKLPWEGLEQFDFDVFLSSSWRRISERVGYDYNVFLSSEKNASYNFFNPEECNEHSFPIEDFRYSLSAAIKRYKYNLLSANSAYGFPPLIERITIMMRGRGIEATEENIIITSGIQQGLSLIAHLFLDPGDTVVLERFTYPGALNVFRSVKAECIGVPVDIDGINLDILENVFKRRNPKLFYCIPTFHNPIGYLLPENQRRALVDLCSRYRVILIEDDYAHELYFDGQEPLSIKSIDDVGCVIYMGSFSETIFPGIRISWIVAPSKIIKKISVLKKSTDLYTNLILQGALVEFIKNGYFYRYIKKKVKILRKLYTTLYNAMMRYFPDYVKFSRIKGGMFQWVELPENLDSLELLFDSRNVGVLFAPDRLFLADEWQKSGFRLSFFGLCESEIWKGIELLGSVIKKNF